MTNITEYSERELSLIVSNDEYFYNEMQKARSFELFVNLLDEFYIYSGEQLLDLEETFNDENSWLNN